MSRADLPSALSGSHPRTSSAGPLGLLPRLSGHRLALESRLRSTALGPGPAEAVRWLAEALGGTAAVDAPEVLTRASGLGRPGVIAHLVWPSRSTRVGLGVETPLVHAAVDRLLGHASGPGEGHLSVTPVEVGILAYVIARTLVDLDADLRLDRAATDPWDPGDLGSIVTVRWPARVGDAAGSIRLWVPESALIEAGPVLARRELAPAPGLQSTWRAVAGGSTLPRGMATLRKGGVVPIDGSPLRGTVASPEGPVILRLSTADGVQTIPARCVPGTAAASLIVEGPRRVSPTPREPIPVSEPNDTIPAAGLDLPVTLAVELGRVNLSLSRLADLAAGDVLPLGRHAREPVELTSGSRLVARGELVQIDTELGVRILSVFL